MRKLRTSAEFARLICDMEEISNKQRDQYGMKEIGISKATHIASKVRKLYKQGGRKAVADGNNLRDSLTTEKHGRVWLAPYQVDRGCSIAITLVNQTRFGIFSRMYWNMKRICG